MADVVVVVSLKIAYVTCHKDNREKESEREAERDRGRESERERERDRDRERARARESQRERERERERQQQLRTMKGEQNEPQNYTLLREMCPSDSAGLQDTTAKVLDADVTEPEP